MSKSTQPLSLEILEDRMMLSSVQILAQGQTGEESMNLLVNDQVVASWNNVNTSSQTYSFESEATIDPRDIRIEFTNDEYRENEGYDRNLSVYTVEVDGNVLSTEDSTTFSTGVYIQGNGITSGFLESTTLHGNGYFQFLQSLDFDGFNWETSANSSSFNVNSSGALEISNGSTEVSMSRQLDNILADQTYTLDYDIERIGEIGRQWATVGINFYDFNGDLIQAGTQQTQLKVNANEPTNVQQVAFSPPDGTTSAFLWLWVNGDDPGASPVVVNQLEVNLSTDPNAPELSQPLSVISVPQFNDGVFEFRATFRDLDLATDGVSSNAFTMVRDDGLELNPYFLQANDYGLEFTGVDVKFAPEGGWTPDFSGEWSVRVNANTVVDASGNAFPESFVEMDLVSLLQSRESEVVSIQIYDPATDNQGPREVLLEAFVSDFSPLASAFVRFVDPNGVNIGWIDEADFFLISPEGTRFGPAQSASSFAAFGDNRVVTTTVYWDLDSVRESDDLRPWQIGVNAGGVADVNGQTNIGGVITSFVPGD